ncbi:MAG: hypothetical protein LBM96_12280 [Methanobrevibacter sp.]|nr:hypothetical protein [Candidatus Methanoflexus mossambicus]
MGGSGFVVGNSSFSFNTATGLSGVIYNMGGSGFVVGDSSFSSNTVYTTGTDVGGVIYIRGCSGFVVGNSSFSSNTGHQDLSTVIYIGSSNKGNITYNRFVNNFASDDKAIYISSGSNVNLSSNWFGSNNITGMISGSNYILDDYFILLLNYSPNGNNTIINSSVNKSKGNYILSFYLALNTSNSTHIFNDTAYLLPEFNKTIIINNGTYNTTYNTTANGFSSEALPLTFNNQLIAIHALVDNEDLSLSLLLEKPDYTNGLYVNSSWSDHNEDGSSWDSPFVNLKSALDAIIKYDLNSTNCNFTIHIAGDDSTHLNNYTGNGINVNLTLNSSYDNLTILGSYGSAVFDGESQYRIFTISGNNICLENIEFNNGKSDYGGAIYNTGYNLSVSGSIFNNNSAENGGAIFNHDGNDFSVSGSDFNNNSVVGYGGAIYNTGDNFSVSGSIFNNNSAVDGGAIENYGDNMSVSGSIFNNNSVSGYGGAIDNSGDNVNINYNSFVNNSAYNGSAIYSSDSNVNINISSNWFGSNNINGMIDGSNYILDDYFVVFLKYLPSNNFLTSSDDDIDVAADSYRLVYLFALNTSSGDDIFNSTVSNLHDFDVRLALSNGSLIPMSIHDAYYETDLVALGFVDSMFINAVVDNEDLTLKLNVIDYSNGLYVNSSASAGGDGHNWSCAFTNLSDALNAIVKYRLNSSNCNFTIHIAGSGLGGAINYTGSRVNVNLDLNSSYNNLNILGSYGPAVFDGESQYLIFTISGNNIILENIEFNNGKASIGGAIYNYGHNLSILSSNFNNNSAGYSAGAIYTNGVNMCIRSSNFNNNAAPYGGAIYTAYESYMLNSNIMNSNFTNNSANRGGGAIYNMDHNLSIKGSIFNNNSAEDYGGAIENHGDNICISGSNFTDNYAEDYGGAVYAPWGNLTIINSNLFNNSVINGSGGAIYINVSSNIKNSNFTKNTAFLDGENDIYGGGAIFNDKGGVLNIENSNFNENNASYYGGAIYSYDDSKLNISSSNFTDNSANDGGAIYSKIFLNIHNTNFTNNHAFYNGGRGEGGVIYTTEGLNITESEFNNNNAIKGGAIYLKSKSKSYIENSKFNNNFATDSGGVIYTDLLSLLTISNSVFNDNGLKGNSKGPDDLYGGVIFIYEHISSNDIGSLNIYNSSFINNFIDYNHDYGGVIHAKYTDLTIVDSNFINNSASDSGGAIYLDKNSSLTLSNSNFTNNSAKNKGGAIYTAYESYNSNIMNSNFNNNSAGYGGAIYNDRSNNFSIISNNFVNNRNNSILIFNANNVFINHNRIYDMDKNHIAVNITNDTIISDVNWDLNYNWWGNNTPDTNYNGLNNYFVVNMIKNNLTNYLYTIHLNGSNDGSLFENKLPSFNGSVYFNYSNNTALVFDSNFNANNSHPLNINSAEIAIFTVDDWKSEFNNKITNIAINNESGTKYSRIAILNASIDAEDGNNTGIDIIFYINGEIVGHNITNNLGNAYYHYKVSFTGNFTYEVCNNDSNHFPTNSSKIYGEFIKSNTNITINSNPNGSKYNNSVIFNATVFDEFGNHLTGDRVDFYINSKFIGSNITDSNGIAIFNYLVGFVGGYNLTVCFNGTDNYNFDSDSVFGEFVKANSNIIINSNINGSKYDNGVVLNATVLDEFGNHLNNLSVDFYVNGVFIGYNVTDSNGMAIFNYLVGFVGGYNLTVCFNGTDNYNFDSDSVFGDFVKADSNIIINSNINGSKYGDGVVLNATVLDEFGNTLNSVIVDFYINNIFIGSNSTDSNGIAIFNYLVGFVGGYNLTVVFNGTDNYNFDSVSVFGEFINLTKVNSNIAINSNSNGSKYGDNVILNATLLDEYDNPLNGVNVDFYINGIFIGSNITGSDGIAILNFNVNFTNQYNLNATFNGNENYTGDSDSVSGEFVKGDAIINLKTIPKTVNINSKLTIKGNLTDNNGKILNGNYKLKIKVNNGKSYTYDVDVVDGLWNLTISNPRLATTNIEITLENNSNYEIKETKKLKYNVVKIKTIITVSTPKITAGKKTNIVVTLKDTDGKILKGKKLIVKSKYLKKPFKAITNSKGQISIRVYVSAIGKYTGTVEFAGDNIYDKSKKTITQIVTGLPDLTFSKIKRIKSSNYQLAVYTVTIKNIGKGDSPKTQLYMQHWKYNGWKSKITKVNIKAIGAGKSITLTVKFLPDRGSHRTCKYQWFYINPLKNFKEISYKNNLKYLMS